MLSSTNKVFCKAWTNPSRSCYCNERPFWLRLLFSARKTTIITSAHSPGSWAWVRGSLGVERCWCWCLDGALMLHATAPVQAFLCNRGAPTAEVRVRGRCTVLQQKGPLQKASPARGPLLALIWRSFSWVYTETTQQHQGSDLFVNKRFCSSMSSSRTQPVQLHLSLVMIGAFSSPNFPSRFLSCCSCNIISVYVRVKDPRVDSGSVYAAVYRLSLTHLNGVPGSMWNQILPPIFAAFFFCFCFFLNWLILDQFVRCRRKYKKESLRAEAGSGDSAFPLQRADWGELWA